MNPMTWAHTETISAYEEPGITPILYIIYPLVDEDGKMCTFCVYLWISCELHNFYHTLVKKGSGVDPVSCDIKQPGSGAPELLQCVD